MTKPIVITEETAVRAAELALEKYGVSQEYLDTRQAAVYLGLSKQQLEY